MDRIRAFCEGDITAVAALRRVCLSTPRHKSDAELCNYLRSQFLHYPWYDESLPSLVHCDESDQIIGFLGVLRRPIIVDGRPSSAALLTQFMVSEDCRGQGVGSKLVERFFSGPQELSLSDIANDSCRKVWESTGGCTVWMYSMRWMSSLRPTTLLKANVNLGRATSLASIALRPLGRVIDTLARRIKGSRFYIPTGELVNEPLLPEQLLECRGLAQDLFTIHLDYDSRGVLWLFEQLAESSSGAVRARLLRDKRQERVGWFIYVVVGNLAEVLELGAVAGSESVVVSHLFADAWNNGAGAIRGQLSPALAASISKTKAKIRRTGPWMLVHSKDPRLSLAFQSGKATFGRLDGEWLVSC